MNNPENKCGYESMWIALQCKKSPLINLYNLNNHVDLYILLRHGNTIFPSLFEEENVKTFYEQCSNNVKNIYDEFKNERLYTDNGAVWKCFWPLVAIYFKIEIILMDQNKQKMETETRLIKELLDTLGLHPKEKIRLHLTPGHVEYIPEDNEIELFKKFKYQTYNEKRTYNYNDDTNEMDNLPLTDRSDMFNIDDWFDLTEF